MSLTTSTLERHNNNRRRESRLSAGAESESGLSASFGRVPSSHSEAGSLRQSESLASPRSARSRSVAPPGEGAEAVKVVCRVRPFARREIEIQDDMNSKFQHEWEKRPLRSVIDMVDGKTTNFLDHEKDYTLRQGFDFDHSLWSVEPSQQESANPTADQTDVYNIVGDPAVSNVWSGFNTCVFAYGQTGSGKTFTMMGTKDEPGLIPRICRQLFDELQRKKDEVSEDPTVTKEYKLEARFLEIYNEKVKDLLWALREPGEESQNLDRENMKIRLIPGVGPQVVGLTTVQVKTPEDCMQLIDEGTSNRAVAATKMNDQSSRSHSIFRLTLTQTTTVLPTKQFEKPKHYHRHSTVSLVDLAGSERNKKTGAEGDRLKEAVAINKSLTTLKNVIDALVEQRQVIPYRDSTLTWLLSDNLGGNSKTFMIACASPHLDNAEETLNTLRYAMRTQSVKTFAHVNEDDELRRMSKMRNDMDKMKAAMLDTGEDALRTRAEELSNSVKHKEEEHASALQLVDLLNEALERTKEMQFNAAYVNRFHTNVNGKAEGALRTASARISQDLELLEGEVERLRKDVAEEENDRDTAAIEERVSRERKESMLADHAAFVAKGADAKALTEQLLLEDQELSDKIDAKAPVVAAARNLAHVLVAYQTRRSELEIDAAAVRRTEETDAERLAQDQQTLAAEKEAVERVSDAQRRQDDLKKAIAKAKEDQASVTRDLQEQARRLHSRCIFWEAENRTCITDNEHKVVELGKAQLTRLQTDEEAAKKKTAAINQSERIRHDRDREQFASQENERQCEHDGGIEVVASQNERLIQKMRDDTNDNVVKLNEDFERRLKLLGDLNVDSETYVKEARFVAPRYAPLHATISASIARRERDLEQKPFDFADIVRKMKAVQVASRRRTATPLAFRSDGDESTVGAITPRSRSVAASEVGSEASGPTSARRAHPRAASPASGATPQRGTSVAASEGGRPQTATPSRSPSAAAFGSTLDHLHSGSRIPAADIGTIKSLKAPKNYTAQPTRSSLLRGSVHNYRRIPGQQQQQQHAGSASPTPLRSNSPTPQRLASRSPARAPAGGVPSNMAQRSERRFRAKQDDEEDGDVPLALSPSLHSTNTASRTFVPADGDGTRKKVIYASDGTSLVSRSKSPARALPRSTSTGELRSTTPVRKASWR